MKSRVDIEFNRAIFVHIYVFGERLPPIGILQIRPNAVVIPVFPAFIPGYPDHVFVRSRIVLGHRRTIRIAGIEVSTARINLDAIIIRMPTRIIVSFCDHIICFSIRLKSML